MTRRKILKAYLRGTHLLGLAHPRRETRTSLLLQPSVHCILSLDLLLQLHQAFSHKKGYRISRSVRRLKADLQLHFDSQRWNVPSTLYTTTHISQTQARKHKKKKAHVSGKNVMLSIAGYEKQKPRLQGRRTPAHGIKRKKRIRKMETVRCMNHNPKERVVSNA